MYAHYLVITLIFIEQRSNKEVIEETVSNIAVE